MLSLSIFVSSLAAVTGCQSRPAEPQQAAQPKYVPDATIKDLMLSIVDPSADVVWLSVTTVMSQSGTVETAPKSDEDWAKVRQGAVTLAEAANLLMMPGRRVARPGEKSETPGVELEPEEMDALIAKDRAAWEQRATHLHEAATEALKAIDAKDAPTLFAIGEKIEEACEGCHSNYWYPNEKIPPVEIKGGSQ